RGEAADEVGFSLAVGCAVGMEDVMEPDGGLDEHVGALPGVPGKIGLRLAVDEAPVDGGDVIAPGDGEHGVEGGTGAASHVFGAEDGAVEGLELLDAGLEAFGPVVVVEGDDVGFGELNFCGGVLACGVAPVVMPDTAGEWLRGMRGACPLENARKKLVDAAHFGDGIFSEAVIVGVVRLVPEVPGKDAGDVGAEFGFNGGVDQTREAGTLHPAGVVNAGDGRVLWTEVRVGLPAGVEENEERADVMLGGDGEKGVEAFLEAV